MAHTPSGQDAVPEAPTSSRPSAQTGDYLAANRNVDSHALSPVMASPAWNTQSPLHYGPETSSGRSGSFNFPSPAPQNNSPAIISGLQQATPTSEMKRPSKILEDLQQQLHSRLASGGTSILPGGPSASAAAPGTASPQLQFQPHHLQHGHSPATGHTSPARVSDTSTSGSDKQLRLGSTAIPAELSTPEWPQQRGSNSSKGNSRSPSKSPVRGSSTSGVSDESVVTLDGGMGPASINMRAPPGLATGEHMDAPPSPVANLPDQTSPSRTLSDRSLPVTPTRRLALQQAFDTVASPGMTALRMPDNGSVSEAGTEVSRVDFNKLINDLQDVETKVMARKMLLEGGSGSSVNTPTTGGSSRRADSVASDASMFLHMGQDLYREHFDNRSPSMQALDAAAAAAGPSRATSSQTVRDAAQLGRLSRMSEQLQEQPRSTLSKVWTLISYVLLATALLGTGPSVANHYCGLYNQQQCTGLYEQYIKGMQLVDIPAVQAGVQRVTTTLHQWHVFAWQPEELPRMLMDWHSAQALCKGASVPSLASDIEDDAQPEHVATKDDSVLASSEPEQQAEVQPDEEPQADAATEAAEELPVVETIVLNIEPAKKKDVPKPVLPPPAPAEDIEPLPPAAPLPPALRTIPKPDVPAPAISEPAVPEAHLPEPTPVAPTPQPLPQARKIRIPEPEPIKFVDQCPGWTDLMVHVSIADCQPGMIWYKPEINFTGRFLNHAQLCQEAALLPLLTYCHLSLPCAACGPATAPVAHACQQVVELLLQAPSFHPADSFAEVVQRLLVPVSVDKLLHKPQPEPVAAAVSVPAEAWTTAAILEAILLVLFAAGSVALWHQSPKIIAAMQPALDGDMEEELAVAETPAAVAAEQPAAGLPAIPEEQQVQEGEEEAAEEPQGTPARLVAAMAAVAVRIMSPMQKPPLPPAAAAALGEEVHLEEEAAAPSNRGRRSSRRTAAPTPRATRGRKSTAGNAAVAEEEEEEEAHTPAASGATVGTRRYSLRSASKQGSEHAVAGAAVGDAEVTSVATGRRGSNRLRGR